MREFLISLLGTYQPVTYTVDGVSYVAQGLAGVDWLYVFTGFAFLLCVFCLFKALGALVCKIF